MEKKQLNFSAPLLSVRRFSEGMNKKIIEKSPHNRQRSLPAEKSDCELGDEVTKPAAVPFQWERIPGKAKGEKGAQSQRIEKPSNTPSLPPGRALETKRHIADKKSGDQTLLPSKNPRLPPNRALDAIKNVSSKKSGDQNSRSSSTPRLPPVRASKKSGVQNVLASNSQRLAPGRALDIIKHISGRKSGSQNVSRPQNEAPSLNDHAAILNILKEDINAKGDSDLDSGSNASSDDANSMLSPTESFSFNCRVSGLSGCNGTGLKPSGTFSTDLQTRDFMMSRFLPAAKAMVLETPQYVSRKQPRATEQIVEVKKVPEKPVEVKNLVERPFLEKHGSSIISQYDQYKIDVESEDKDDKYDDMQKMSTKACGLLPRICAKNSLSLFNPVLGMKSRTQTSMPSPAEVNRRTRIAHSGPSEKVTQPSPAEVNRRTRIVHSGPLEKYGCGNVYKKKFHSGILSRELQETGNKLMGESNKYSYSGELYMIDAPSPYSRLRSSGISPYRNRPIQSPFQSEARFLGIPKEIENKNKKFSSSNGGCNGFQDKLSCELKKQESGSASPVVEKTLYVDSVNDMGIPISNTFLSGRPTHCSGKNFKTLVENREKEETSTAKSSDQDMRCLTLLEGERITEPKASIPLKGHVADSSGLGLFKLGQGLDQEEPPSSLEILDITNPADPSQSPRPPPLPKSPSESWLWRILPSSSLQNPLSESHLSSQFQPKKQVQKSFTAGTKWETLVKTSNVWYSEELIPQVSQHSKS